MYSNQFVVAVKHQGKVLREVTESKSDPIVFLPFGSEYSLLLKNNSNKRADVKVFIDGENVTNGSVIVDSNSSFDLERFIKDLDKGARFKFVEKTKEIEEYRGNKEEDGLVRVEVKYEIYSTHYIQNPPIQNPWYNPNITWTSSSGMSGRFSGDITYTNSISCSPSINMTYVSESNDGVTVPGSESNQKFQLTNGFNTEYEPTIFVLKLRGKTNETQVKKPLTVETRYKCNTCGRTSKSNVSYCSNCGTNLVYGGSKI